MARPSVHIFRSRYLPLSETFISDHLRHLRRYQPHVLCEWDEPTPHRIDLDPTVVYGGRVGRWAFSQYGHLPTSPLKKRPLEIDLLHAHFLTDAARVLPLARRLEVPLIVTAHGYDATTTNAGLAKFPDGQLLLDREAALQEYVSRFVCVSDFIHDELKGRGYPPEKLITIPLGVDLPLLPQRAAGETGSGIITVGRLVEKKGTRFLIEAFAQLTDDIRREHPLTIIGDGPLRAELEHLALGLGVKAAFLGGLPREAVLDRVRASRIFAFPSIRAESGDAEGMPIAIMEAMAIGVPIVTSTAPPLGPFLNQNGCGLTAEAGDPASLMRAIQQLLESKEVAATIVRAARHCVEAQFSLPVNVSKLETLYDSVSAKISQTEKGLTGG